MQNNEVDEEDKRSPYEQNLKQYANCKRYEYTNSLFNRIMIPLIEVVKRQEK